MRAVPIERRENFERKTPRLEEDALFDEIIAQSGVVDLAWFDAGICRHGCRSACGLPVAYAMRNDVEEFVYGIRGRERTACYQQSVYAPGHKAAIRHADGGMPG